MEEPNEAAKRLEAEDAEQPLGLDTAKLEAMRLLQVGGMSFAYLGTISRLTAAELILSAKTVPKLVGVGLFLVPIVYFAWLGLSALISWAVFTASASSLLAVAVFFLLQCLLLVLGFWYIKRASRLVGLPQTKAQLSALIETVKHEFQGERTSAQ